MTSCNETPALHAPLVQRLVSEFGARWLGPQDMDPWLAEGGTRVLLLAGDPVRFPEGVDVAAVLPELLKAFPGRFSMGAVPLQHEDAIARRYGSQRWPSLLFFREGQYVTAIAGMQDWEVFLQRMSQALEMPASRPPTIGIPLVAQHATGGCH